MKRKSTYYLSILAALAGLVSCTKEGLSEDNNLAPDLTFKTCVVSAVPVVRSGAPERKVDDIIFNSSTGNGRIGVSCECIDVVSDTEYQNIQTKATTVLFDSFTSFKVAAWSTSDKSAYVGGKFIEAYQTVTKKDGKWGFDNMPKWDNRDEKAFFAYSTDATSPYVFECASATCQTMTYTVPDVVANHKDVLLGDYIGTTIPDDGTKPTGEVTLSFAHPLSAVTFKLENIAGVTEITKIEIQGFYANGTLTHTPGNEFNWSIPDDQDSGTLSATDMIDKDLLFIPQDFTSDKPLTVKVYVSTGQGDDIYVGFINSGSWEAGKHYIYTLGDNLPLIEVTDNKTVKNIGTFQCYVRATVTGNWYVGNMIVAPWTYGVDTLSGWTSKDGYFYCTTALDPGAETSAISIDKTAYTKPASAPDGAVLKVRIHAQASGEPF